MRQALVIGASPRKVVDGSLAVSLLQNGNWRLIGNLKDSKVSVTYTKDMDGSVIKNQLILNGGNKEHEVTQIVGPSIVILRLEEVGTESSISIYAERVA